VTGTKHDRGKRPWHLIPWDGLGPAVDVLRMGAAKYGERNWEQGIKYSRLFAATMRHLTAWWESEDKDPESGLSPLAHALCDVLFLLAFVVRGRTDLDDRPESRDQSRDILEMEGVSGRSLRSCGTCRFFEAPNKCIRNPVMQPVTTHDVCIDWDRPKPERSCETCCWYDDGHCSKTRSITPRPCSDWDPGE
jgi:hypothetical protein